MLDKKGCQIQVKQDVITVSQGDRIILKEEKCGGIYKLKGKNSIQGGVSVTSLKGPHREMELQGKL